MASKKRSSGKGKGPRRGISGNPQRRAEQLAQRLAIADEPDRPPLALDFRSGNPEYAALRDLAYALAGGAEPRPFAARSRAAALTEAAALVHEERHDPAAEREEAPFRRQE